MILDNARITYKVIDVEEKPELAARYAISQAPTLIVTNGEGFEKFANASNIKKFAEAKEA